MSMLENAKFEGLKVTPDGKIILPGTMAKKAPKEKKVKEPKTPKAPKEKKVKEVKAFRGFTGNVYTDSFDTLSKMIEGINLLKEDLGAKGLLEPFKISNYKNEMRLAFLNTPGAELIGKMELKNAQKLNELGWTCPDGKSFLAFEIATDHND